MDIEATRDPGIQEKLAELRDDYPNDNEAGLYAAVADFFELEDDMDRVMACQEQAVALAPNDAEHVFRLARSLLKREKWKEGGKMLERCSDLDALSLAGRHWSVNNMYYLAYALFNVGRYKEAAEAFAAALEIIDIWGDARILKNLHLHAGWAWHAEKNFAKASQSYLKALVAPGPGDSCDEDVMDPDEVEAAQAMNEEIEPFLLMAQEGEPLSVEGLEARPAFPG